MVPNMKPNTVSFLGGREVPKSSLDLGVWFFFCFPPKNYALSVWHWLEYGPRARLFCFCGFAWFCCWAINAQITDVPLFCRGRKHCSMYLTEEKRYQSQRDLIFRKSWTAFKEVAFSHFLNPGSCCEKAVKNGGSRSEVMLCQLFSISSEGKCLHCCSV